MYTWNFDRNAENWNNGEFDNVAECLQEASKMKEYYKLETEIVYVAETKPYTIYCNIDALLDQVGESAYDEIGEAAEDWYTYDPVKDKDDLEKLEKEITQLVTKFLEKTNNLPHFYYIENVKSYNLNTGKLVK